MKRTLILVLAADNGYSHIVEGIRETWGRTLPEGARVLYYYGRREGHPRPQPGRVLRLGDTLICDVRDSLDTVLAKTLMAFEHVLATEEFDYVFRCCCGSYVDTRALVNFVQDKPTEKFYCGVPREHWGYPYAAGSGYFLSKDLVRLIVAQKDAIEEFKFPGHIDDVAVGRVLQQTGVAIYPGAVVLENTSAVREGCYHYHFRATLRYMHDLHANVARLYLSDGSAG